MKFERYYSTDDRLVNAQVEWIDFLITDPKTGEKRAIAAPKRWSQNAATILATKYMRRAGVPSKTKLRIEALAPLPEWLWPRVPAADADFGAENTAHQVFHRLAGHWTYWAWREGVVNSSEHARILYDETYMMLALQVAAPNSPQWFNTGLWWAYGIEGTSSGRWVFEDGVAHQVDNEYERPQISACFIQPVSDNLVNDGGMMDLWTREARLFKGGSGSGSNMSAIRGKGEPLSGGGTSSGLMSFLEVGDRSAGSIQSGGTTRRAALMRVLDLDHPEIEDFIWWKEREEAKAAALSVGSKWTRQYLEEIASEPDDSHCETVLGIARELGIPEAMIDRAREGIIPDELPVGFESEALRTVSGQNSNNSVRVTDDFLDRVAKNEMWQLTARTDGSVVKEIPARTLWDEICTATWAAGDPGVQFHDTMNDWNTCPESGHINASNPCSEFLWHDNTACTLASLRLTAFLRNDGTLDLDAYERASRIWTVILDLSVSMASYPSRDVAENDVRTRPIGLGYCDLGGLLMRLAIPYDSDEGRALAGALTALLTGVAYRTSAELAAELGPFPEWCRNREHMDRVLHNHARSAQVLSPEWENLSIVPQVLDLAQLNIEMYRRVGNAWSEVTKCELFRNAQVTLIAPTGTIGLLMDCDTLGIEPDFSLVKHKNLAGGGSMWIINAAVSHALARLNYDEGDIHAIEAHLHANGELPIGGPVRVKLVDLNVFACSMPAGAVDAISPEAHVRMVAAVQPFLSGGVSKTVNLPRDATVEDVRQVYLLAHSLGVKAVAPYRDGSKLTQPLQAPTRKTEQPGILPEEGWKPIKEVDDYELAAAEDEIIDATLRAAFRETYGLPRGERELPPWERDGKIQKAKIGEQSIWITVGHYPDGRPCEVFLNLAKEGSTLRGMADLLGIAMSLGLQFGVPMAEFVERFTHTKFEPAGLVEGHAEIAITSSIGDLLGRHLGIRYCAADGMGDKTRLPSAEAAFSDQAHPASAAVDGMVVASGAGQVPRLAAENPPAPRFQPTGDVCPYCHNATLVPNGSCRVCTTCNESVGGCGA